MKSVTSKTIGFMTGIAYSSQQGGDVYTPGSLRPLFSMPDLDTSFTGLATYFDRAEIEEEWTKAAVNPEVTQHMLMVPTAENDLVSTVHRDTMGRYSDRIMLILAEMGTRHNQADESVGVINSIRINLLNFESLKPT